MVGLVNSFGRKIAEIGEGSVAAPTALPNTDQNRNYNLDGTGNWKNSIYTPVGGSQTTDQRSNNQLNQITQRTIGTGSLVKFQYDGQATPATGNGNLTNDGTLIYQYDALNRLIQVNRVSDGLVIAAYLYDANNRRVRKTIANGGLAGNIPNGTTDYIWQGWQTMEERNPFGGSGSTDTPVKQYVWGQYIDECIQLNLLQVAGPQSLPAGAYYLLQDLLYRAVALTNSSGAIVEAYDTDAYGNTLIFTAPDTTGNWWGDAAVQSNYGASEIIYCGYRYDPETENYYVRNRTYNPALGRWVTRDPIGYDGGINLYGYVESAPVGMMDSSGLRLVELPIRKVTLQWIRANLGLPFKVVEIHGKIVAIDVTLGLTLWSRPQVRGNVIISAHRRADGCWCAKIIQGHRIDVAVSTLLANTTNVVSSGGRSIESVTGAALKAARLHEHRRRQAVELAYDAYLRPAQEGGSAVKACGLVCRRTEAAARNELQNYLFRLEASAIRQYTRYLVQQEKLIDRENHHWAVDATGRPLGYFPAFIHQPQQPTPLVRPACPKAE